MPTPTVTESVNPQLNFFNLEQLFALEPESTPFIVEGLLPNSGVSLLTGRPKAGKSHLARQLVASVACNEPFLGREVTSGDVLYYALEEKAHEVRDHFETLGLRNARHEVFTRVGAAYDNPMESLRELVDARPDLRLIIVDPVMRLMRVRDGNSYAEVGRAIEPLMVLARNRDIHVMIVHHTRKGQADDPRDATLGSQALNGAVDTILSLQETNGNRVISSAQRYGVGLQQTSLIWDSTDRRMSLGGSYDAPQLRGNTHSSEAAQGCIFDYLAGNPNSVEEEVRKGIGMKGMTVSLALRALTESGRIMRNGVGVKNDPHRFSLAEISVEAATS